MEQRCNLAMIWLTWATLPALALLVAWWQGWGMGAVVLLAGVAAQPAYVRVFPRISRALGYGPVADVAATALPGEIRPGRVVLYTASACPFCPIVKRRLLDLQAKLKFDLEVIDVTFKPGVVQARGLRSVPVVEAGGRFLVGNATSAQLASFLTDAAPTAPAPA